MLRAPNGLSWITAFLIGTAAPASAGEVELVSRVHPRYISDTAATGSWISRMSADGRWLAFVSSASNVVSGQVDSNGINLRGDESGGDVFLYDRTTGTTVLVSRSTAGPTVTGNRSSEEVAISADGRFVAFASYATDLVENGPVDENDAPDIYLYDRVNGTTELLSDPGATVYGETSTSRSPVLSADGRYVAFVTGDKFAGAEGDKDDNPALIPNFNVFLYDRIRGTSTRIVPPDGSRYEEYEETDHPSISADGRWLAFSGRSPVDDAGAVFLYDRVSGKISLVSHASSSPTQTANGFCLGPSISADGAFVVYECNATNLVPGQRGGQLGLMNVFLFRRSTGETALVSHARNSLVRASNGSSGGASISADGSWIAFASHGTDLVAGQTAGESSSPTSDVFLYHRTDGKLTLLSRSASSPGRVANGSSAVAGISADGGSVLLASQATDLVAGVTDVNREADLFRYDRRAGRMELVSHTAHSASTAASAVSAEMSADGQWISWASFARDLVSGVRDTGRTPDLVLQGEGERILVSRRAPDLPSVTPSGWSSARSISADGRFVAFLSDASLLVGGQRDRNGGNDVFLHDRLTRTTTLVSRSAAAPRTTGNRTADGPSMSADGRFLVFLSEATDLVAGQVDSPGTVDAFLYDRVTGSLTLASRSATSPVTSGSRFLSFAAISADGSSVFFRGSGDGLLPGEEGENLFVYDRISGQVSRVIPGGVEISISADGRFLAFTSTASGLDPEVVDANEREDVFFHDRVSGRTTLISRAAAAPEAAGGFNPRISADGQVVTFISGGGLVLLYDRVSGATQIVSRAGGSPSAGAPGWDPEVSANGRFVVFASASPDILPGQNAEGEQNVYLFDRTTGSVELISRAADLPPGGADSLSRYPQVSADGRVVVFLSLASNLVPGQSGPPETFQLFLHDRATGTTELVSRSLASPAQVSEAEVLSFVLSGSGEAVAFSSPASDLVSDDHNLSSDVFVYISRR